MTIRSALISVVVLTASAAPAFAANGFTAAPGEVGFTTHAMPATRSRAAVLKDLEQARADGSLWFLQRNLPVPLKAGNASGKTRDQVRQELLNMTEAEKSYMRELYESD